MTTRKSQGKPSGYIPLRVAASRQRDIPGFLPNSYAWYREVAASQGNMPVGSRRGPVKKIGGTWGLQAKLFEAALAAAIKWGRRWLRSEAYTTAYLKGRKRI